MSSAGALALLALAAAGCLNARRNDGAPPAPQEQTRAEGAGIQGSARADDAAPRGEKFQTFRGQIGSFNVEMRLRRAGPSLEGAYFYTNRKTDIELRGQVDAQGNFTLRESSGGAHTGTFKGRWADDEETGRLMLGGEWTKPDGTGALSFLLTEHAVEFSAGRTLVTKELREENKRLRYTVEAEYPRIEGGGGDGAARFNGEAERFVRGKVAEFKNDVAESAGEGPHTETGSDISITYDVGFADDELVSVVFTVGSYYSGAAHPNSYTEVINFDLRRGRRLQLADLFKPSSDYLARVSRYSVNALKAQSRKHGPEPLLDDAGIEEGAGPDPENYKSWVITRRGLSLTFDAYQVGPYAAGPQYVFIPFAELKDIIRAGGPVARFAP